MEDDAIHLLSPCVRRSGAENDAMKADRHLALTCAMIVACTLLVCACDMRQHRNDTSRPVAHSVKEHSSREETDNTTLPDSHQREDRGSGAEVQGEAPVRTGWTSYTAEATP